MQHAHNSSPTPVTQADKGNRIERTIIVNRNLFSSYYIGTLLDQDVKKRQGEVGLRLLRTARMRLQNQWNRVEPTFGPLTSYARTRQAWLNTLLQTLGYEPLEDARAADFKERTLPDGFLLYRSVPVPSLDQPVTPIEPAHHVQLDLQDALPFAESLTDEDDTDDQEPPEVPPVETPERKEHGVLISLLAWDADFDRPFAQKMRRNETPHKLMERLLVSGGPARWGILCNGRSMRLLKQDVITGRQQYLEVNLEALFESGNAQDDLTEHSFTTFWTLFRAQAFQPAADDLCFLDEVDRKSRDHAAGVSTRLKFSVFNALDDLMKGLVNQAHDLINTASTEPRRRMRAQEALDTLPELHRQSLVFLYRLLFVLYAESRTLLPVDNTIYRDSYSLDPLRHEILYSQTPYQPDSYRMWETLQSLARLIHWGCNTAQMVVPAYDGNLFDPQSTILLNALRVPDKTMAQVIRQLSETPPTKERGRELIDYRDLGVEQLGAVYEGLLELEPHIAKELMVEVQHKDIRVIIPEREKRDYEKKREIQPGEFYLGRGAGRKTSGSYYTPQTLVDFLVKRTLDPLVENKSPEQLLELKIVDPAMGSGAFLVGACLYLADAYARAVKREEEMLSLDRISDGAAAEQADTEAPPQPYRRVAEIQNIYNIGEAAVMRLEESNTEFVTQRGVTANLSEEDTRPYRRLVAERCLYGVDLNPMAVELAKVSLWLITLAGDRPLTFLDANLRWGNSLINAPLRVADYDKGTFTIYTIHPEANKRIARESGATVLKWSGKQGKGRSLWDTDEDEDEEEEAEPYTIEDEKQDVQNTVPALIDTRRWIADTPSDTVTNVHDKAAQFKRRIVENERRKMLEQICNLWVASWFWRPFNNLAQPGDPDWVPALNGQIYTDLVNCIRWQAGEDVTPVFIKDPSPYFVEVRKIIETVHPLHWELEFPEIYFESDGLPRANPGFDAVLGNPPWDIVMTNSLEFFSAYDPGFRELERVKAMERQQGLLDDKEIKMGWESYVREFGAQVNYFGFSNIYPRQAVEVGGKRTRGHVNTYKLFLERSLERLGKNGILGMIVPSGIYIDQGCTGLRQLFIEHAQISYLLCFENRQKIFPIDSRFKFVLFGANKAEASGRFDAAFMLNDLEVLAAPEEYSLSIPTPLIRRFSPDTLSIMEFRSQRDIDIIAHIYGDRPLLGETVWDITLAREFNLTDDRHLFNQNALGWSLYEGKMIHQYTHLYSKTNHWIEITKGRDELARREIQHVEEAVRDYLRSLSRGKSSKQQANLSAILKMHGRRALTIEDVRLTTDIPRLVFRKVASHTNERTLISAILPAHVFAVYTVTGIVPWRFNPQKAIEQLRDIQSCYTPTLQASEMMYICGIFNSFTLDYVIRFKITTDVNMFHVYQLPVPRLMPNDQHCRAIAHRVAQLVCIGPEFDELRRELLGDINAHVATDLVERQQLQAEIDALVAHLYGLSVEDLHHILYAPYTFWLVKREIKDGVMEAFGQVEELLVGEI